MKIAFPEYDNEIIKAAIERAENIEAIKADSLEDACEKTKNGDADALIAGIDCPTRDVVLACKNRLGMKDKTFSSFFLLKPSLPDSSAPSTSRSDTTGRPETALAPNRRTYLLADAGVTKSPTAAQLEDIVLQTYDSARKLLEDEPRIALLSFSTKGSAKDESIDKIQTVLEKIRTSRPEIKIDGELQLDAAVNPRVAEKKAPGSEVAGRANVLIVPDLNSGNILYKSFEQFSGYTAAGPVLQGFLKPASDLSRGSTVEDVLLVIDTILKLANV